MPGKSIMARITEGNMTVGAVAKVLGIQRSRVVTLSNQNVLRYKEDRALVKSLSKLTREAFDRGEQIQDEFLGRQIYHTKRVYDIDSIASCAVLLLCKEGNPITKDLYRLIAMHGSEEALRKLYNVRAAVKVKKIMIAVSKGDVSPSKGLGLYAASLTPETRELTARGKTLEVMYENDSDTDIQKEMQKKGVTADFLVMRSDQEPLKEGTVTFTFTSEMKCFADILGIASYILTIENKEAGELLMALALRNGFVPEGKNDWLLETDLSREFDEHERIKKERDAKKDKATTIKTVDDAASAIRQNIDLNSVNDNSI